MNEEIWKPVLSLGGRYEVSNLGRIRHSQRMKLRNFRIGKGYARFNVAIKDSLTTMMVHKLVAEAFLPSMPTDCDRLNHKDGNKLNNRADNLEWTDSLGNGTHAKVLGLYNYGDRNGRAKLTWDQVEWIKRNKTMTRNRMAKMLGVTWVTVNDVLTGASWIVPPPVQPMSAIEAQTFLPSSKNRA